VRNQRDFSKEAAFEQAFENRTVLTSRVGEQGGMLEARHGARGQTL
jgi:hypothetical protein